MIRDYESPVVESPLPASIGDALAELAAEVKNSVVQVRSGDHGSGSGIVWRADGIIMTNHHVVAGRKQATVLFADNRELQARVIASDPILDLAALKVDAIGLPAAAVGSSMELRVGQLVLAVGNPWGLRGIVTAGIVSGVGAIETGWRRGKAEYIRSDVRLAPGNSGGPMLDASGAVIGINAMIFGGDLSVAIPSHIATQFLAVAEGQNPTLGVAVQPVELPPTLRSHAERERGMLVVGLQDAGAAARSGIVLGDVLLDVASRPVDEPHDLKYALAQQQWGARIGVRVLRGGTVRDLDVVLDSGQPAQAAA